MENGKFTKNLGNSVIGNIEKAHLSFFKYKERKVTYFPKNELIDIPKLTETYGMEVQYNPSSIEFQANTESVQYLSLQSGVDSGVPNHVPRDPSIVLSVELIFDEVNVNDAFMLEKLRITNGVTDISSSIAAAIKAKSKKGYTVQPQIEALIGMILRPSTNEVEFNWADMSFKGKVAEMNASYSMFSVSGKPIRGKVRLNIMQQTKSGCVKWDNAFTKCFGKANDTGPAVYPDKRSIKHEIKEYSGGKDTWQKNSNLINIGF